VLRAPETLSDEKHAGLETILTPRTAARGAALYVALSIAMTWPLAARLGSELPAGGDNLYVAWSLAWIAHALAHAPMHLPDGNIFFPVRSSLAFSDPNVSSGLLLAPLHYAGASPATLLAVLLLVSFILGGLATAMLTAVFGGEARIALAAGVFFAFSPLRFSHLDHLQLYASWWIPLALATLDRYLRDGRRIDAWLTAASIGFQAYTSIYLVVFQVTALTLLAAMAIVTGRTRRPLSGLVGGLVAPAVAVAIVSAPLGAVYLTASRTWALVRSLEENAYYSASPLSWLSSAPTNVLWGRALARFSDANAPWEKLLFPGLAPVVLGAVALSRQPKSFQVRFGIVLFALAAMLSLGPFLNFAGHTVRLPYGYGFDWLPPLRALRVPARWALLGSLGLSLAAAAGLARLPRAVFWPVVAFAVAEAWVIPPLTVPLPNGGEAPPVYRFLAESSGPLIELPLASSSAEGYRLEPPRVYWSTLHWRPIANGYSGYTPPPYRELVRLFEGESPAEALRFLGAWNLTTVVVHLDEMNDEKRATWDRPPDVEGIGEVYRDDRTRVFHLSLSPPPFAPAAATVRESRTLAPRVRQSLALAFEVGRRPQAVPAAAIGWSSGRARWTAEGRSAEERWVRYFCPPAIPSRLSAQPLFVEPPPVAGRYRLELDARCFELSADVTVADRPEAR
jgi:hypothetical protein